MNYERSKDQKEHCTKRQTMAPVKFVKQPPVEIIKEVLPQKSKSKYEPECEPEVTVVSFMILHEPPTEVVCELATVCCKVLK